MLIEVTTFALAPDTDRKAFLAADHDLQEELSSRPGFVRRTTAEGESGWVVLTMWGDEPAADAANERIANHQFSAAVTEARRGATTTSAAEPWPTHG